MTKLTQSEFDATQVRCCGEDDMKRILADLLERVAALEVRRETSAKIAALGQAHADTAKSTLRFGPPDPAPEHCPNCGCRLRGNAHA